MKVFVLSALCAAASLSLTGCCTAHHQTACEHKTYEAVVPGSYTGANPLDEGLNKLSSEGWVVQSFSPKPGDSQRLIFLLKRPQH
jgi:hypothetical protein